MSAVKKEGKQHLSYAQFLALPPRQALSLAVVTHCPDRAVPVLADFRDGTVAWVIQRYIDEMDGADGGKPIKPLGESHRCTLRVLQRMPIGRKQAASLTRTDIIDMCKDLIKERLPSTVNQYVTFLRGVLAYAVDWDGCENVSDACIKAARKKLQKYNLIGKSVPRKRRPSDEEVAMLLTGAAEYAKHPRSVMKQFPDMIAFALASSRRRGEIVRIPHKDVDYEKKIYWVRDLKHPTRKKGNDKSFILWPELEEIIKRQPRASDDPNDLIFPVLGKTLGKAYVELKKRLGIKGLRFHDNRRDCISRWLLKMPPEDVRLAVSGHDNSKILETNYDGRSSMEIMQEKYQGLMQRPELRPT